MDKETARVLAYGEDSLTFWAIQNRLGDILEALKDDSDSRDCLIFYRPSFGRSGGPDSSQLGEFDFILLAEDHVYLGESKWDGSSERIVDGKLELREEQLIRHKLMNFYIHEWFKGSYSDWREFEPHARQQIEKTDIDKLIAPPERILSTNLQFVLDLIKRRYKKNPRVKNILLYLHRGSEESKLPQKADDDFLVVKLDYSPDLRGNFIILNI